MSALRVEEAPTATLAGGPRLTQTEHSRWHGATCHSPKKSLFAFAGFPIRAHNLVGKTEGRWRTSCLRCYWGRYLYFTPRSAKQAELPFSR
jgi:hypothetical protein